MENRIRLLVVDDHLVVRKGIAMCLARRKNLELVGEAGNAREAIALAHALRPDVALMDAAMPETSGLTATEQLLQELPELKVLILSTYEDPEFMRQAIQAGAQGYLLKGVSAEELAHAVETVYRGETCFSPNLMRVTLNQFVKGLQEASQPRLTKREHEVLVQIAEGRSNKATAAELGVSVRTVETHRENLMRKLGIHSAAGLARFAVGEGLVPAYTGAATAAV